MDPLFGRFALFISYGFPFLELLELAVAEAETRATAAALRRLKARLEQGATIAEAAADIALFRPHLALIALGERIGALDTAFAEIAQKSDLRIDFLNWLSVDLQYKPFGEAFAECVAILPPAERRAAARAKPETLGEAALRLPSLFPPPLGVLLSRDLPDEECRTLLMRAAEGRRSGSLPASAKSLRDGLLRTFSGLALSMRAGLPVAAGLEAVAASLPPGKLASALRAAAAKFDAPVMLAKSMEDHPELFSAAIRRMVLRAEEGGGLERACDLIVQGILSGVLRA